ncbi:MAG: hypothetical protein MMC33_004216 [Icmadophila ericetorum]|nr:hypothetical protein [Icmadophila ericetorum]
MHIPYFLIFYSTTFTFLSLVLVGLLLITPGDIIYQAYRDKQLYYIFIVAGTYVLTFLIAVLIYSTRLYINKNHLAGIPRAWIPIEKGDVVKTVRRMIVESLARSVSIAYEGHPRDLSQDKLQSRDGGKSGSGSKGSAGLQAATREDVQATRPAWGNISHSGWSSPSSLDLSNVHFEPVILELPHLIEAKAVSLAPPDPLFEPQGTPTDQQNFEPPLPDAQAVEILQRPATMGLRDYFSHLTSIGMINPPTLGKEFLDLYEFARFSTRALTEPDFRKLMDIFASILRGMKELDPAIVADIRVELNEGEDAYSQSFSSGPASDAGAEADTDTISTTSTVEHTPFQTPFQTPHPDRGLFSHYHTPDMSREGSEGTDSLAGSEGTIRTAPSRATRRTKSKIRNKSRETRATASSRHASSSNFRRHISESSLRRVETQSSTSSSKRSGGSVIRLAEARGPLDLPYAISPVESAEPDGGRYENEEEF